MLEKCQLLLLWLLLLLVEFTRRCSAYETGESLGSFCGPKYIRLKFILNLIGDYFFIIKKPFMSVSKLIEGRRRRR